MPDDGQPDLPLTIPEILRRRHLFMVMVRVQREGQARLAQYEVNSASAPQDVLLEMLIKHDSDIVERRLIDDLNRVPISDRIYEIGALHDHSELFTYVDYRGDPDIQQDNCGICISSIYVDSIRQLPCGHRYHLSCIYEWFGRSSNPRSCPTCRQTYILTLRDVAADAKETEEDIEAAAILSGMGM